MMSDFDWRKQRKNTWTLQFFSKNMKKDFLPRAEDTYFLALNIFCSIGVIKSLIYLNFTLFL